MSDIKYTHTNIIAKDWRKLADFYINVFQCVPVFPERDLSGEWIEKMTDIKNVVIKGIHLKLPGYENGPTLEIFSYNELPEDQIKKKINNQGLGHIAFHVNDVWAMLNKIIKNGGSQYGELIENEIQGIGILTAVYAKDPEDNIIEIQNWRSI